MTKKQALLILQALLGELSMQTDAAPEAAVFHLDCFLNDCNPSFSWEAFRGAYMQHAKDPTVADELCDLLQSVLFPESGQ